MSLVASTWQNEGKRILYTNSSTAIAAGDVVPVVSGNSGIVGVAVTAIAATTGTGQVEIQGRYTVSKTTGEAFTQGQLVYWNATTGCTAATTSNTRAGRVALAAASADTTCDLILNQI
jgi:predicted RecA/RadA family phage recombinase